MHASIAPSAAVAKFEDNELELWTHSQGIYLLRASLAELFHMPDEKIKIYHRSNSGCYGHNGAKKSAVGIIVPSVILTCPDLNRGKKDSGRLIYWHPVFLIPRL